jgi:hypothetical protein
MGGWACQETLPYTLLFLEKIGWTADLKFTFLLNGVPNQTYIKLTYHALSSLPEYYVNQNYVLTLHYSLQHSIYL